MPLNHCHESIKTIRSNHCKPFEREEFDKNPLFHPCSISSWSTFSSSPPWPPLPWPLAFYFKRRGKRNSSRENGIRMRMCEYSRAEDACLTRESRASGKRRNYVIPGRYARHATDSNPVKRSPFGLCIPYVLPLSHLSQREIPQPERACRRNRRASAGACARRVRLK